MNFQKKDQTMTSQQLAASLNASGCKTTYDTEYEGKRGTDKLKSATFKECMNEGDVNTADNIASVFTNKDGNTPWY